MRKPSNVGRRFPMRPIVKHAQGGLVTGTVTTTYADGRELVTPIGPGAGGIIGSPQWVTLPGTRLFGGAR